MSLKLNRPTYIRTTTTKVSHIPYSNRQSKPRMTTGFGPFELDVEDVTGQMKQQWVGKPGFD